MSRRWMLVIGLALLITPLTRADDEELGKAEQAFRKGDFKAARQHAATAAKLDPKRAEAHQLLGVVCLRMRDNQAAVEAFSAVIKLNPKFAESYDRRGDAYLKLGKFDDAVKDFDKVLELKPEFKPEHWRRGIALYYAGKYAEGVKQFETHKIANPQDVENAVWHYLCNAKATKKESAREQLIDVTKDTRVPMKEIQLLFAGKVKPQDVMAAAEKLNEGTDRGVEARFYAHLYVALYYESEGDTKKVIEHLTPAVDKYVISHYMWDVAKVHLAMLKKGK